MAALSLSLEARACSGCSSSLGGGQEMMGMAADQSVSRRLSQLGAFAM